MVIADRGVASARVLVSVDERKDSTASGDQLRPKPATGISISPGMPLAADRWWSGGITLSGDDEGWLLVDNPSSTDSASIKLLVHGDGKVEAAEGLDDFKIEAGASWPSTSAASSCLRQRWSSCGRRLRYRLSNGWSAPLPATTLGTRHTRCEHGRVAGRRRRIVGLR